MKQNRAKLKRERQVAKVPRAHAEPSRLIGQRVGRLIEWSSVEGPRVDYPGNTQGPILARSIVALDETSAVRAIAEEREVLLAFDAGQDDRPIIVGLLTPPPGSGTESSLPSEALIDGKRVVLEGHDEIVLRCGKASITLRRNGRLVVRGTYVETRAEGVNRIKGGSVQVN